MRIVDLSLRFLRIWNAKDRMTLYGYYILSTIDYIIYIDKLKRIICRYTKVDGYPQRPRMQKSKGNTEFEKNLIKEEHSNSLCHKKENDLQKSRSMLLMWMMVSGNERV